MKTILRCKNAALGLVAAMAVFSAGNSFVVAQTDSVGDQTPPTLQLSGFTFATQWDWLYEAVNPPHVEPQAFTKDKVIMKDVPCSEFKLKLPGGAHCVEKETITVDAMSRAEPITISITSEIFSDGKYVESIDRSVDVDRDQSFSQGQVTVTIVGSPQPESNVPLGPSGMRQMWQEACKAFVHGLGV